MQTKSSQWRLHISTDTILPCCNLTAGAPILDVGCGPGTITVDLATRVPQGFVYGIDPSAEVIEKAQKYAADKGVTNVRFETGDIFDIKSLDGVQPATFDVVHAHQVLQHLSDPLSALKTMKQLVKPGGILAVRDCNYSAMDWYPEHAGLDKWKSVYIQIAEGVKAHPNIGKYLHAVALQAGFARADIDVSIGTWTFSTPDEREFWCGLWADRTIKSDYKQRALEGGFATEQDLDDIVAAWRDLQEKEDGWFAVINGQIICHVR